MTEMIADNLHSYLRDGAGRFGNVGLWALDQLNNVCKHRRPTILVQKPTRIASSTGPGDPYGLNGNLWINDHELIYIDEPDVFRMITAPDPPVLEEAGDALLSMHLHAKDAIVMLARLVP